MDEPAIFVRRLPILLIPYSIFTHSASVVLRYDMITKRHRWGCLKMQIVGDLPRQKLEKVVKIQF